MPGRYILIAICVLQLVTTLERQVFDFLGYMWTPIICNFLHIIVVIVCLFGASQYRSRFIVVYTLFGVLWVSWNVFLICFYLSIGSLDRNKNLNLLNLSAGGKSWWLENGLGCQVIHNFTVPQALSSGRQAVGVCVSCLFTYHLWQDDDTFQIEDYDDMPPKSRMTAVNDELEYVKMRYKPPSRTPYPDPYGLDFSSHPIAPINPAFDDEADDEPPSYRESYIDSYRQRENVNHVPNVPTVIPNIATPPPPDRRSMRSARSARSTKSSKSNRDKPSKPERTNANIPKSSSRNHLDRTPEPSNVRPDLPWVQITPSRNYNEVELHGYDGHFV